MSQDRIVVPNRVRFTLTGKCNNFCTWCMRKGSEIDQFLDLNLFTTALHTLGDAGTSTCTLTGGEPTLHPGFSSILAEIAKEERFSSCALVTNGRSFAKEVPEALLGKTKFHITVSMHGADEQEYFKNTQAAEGFQQAVRGIRNLVNAGTVCSMSVVLGPENLQRKEDFIALAAELSVQMLCFTIGISSIDDASYVVDPYGVVRELPAIAALCEVRNLKYCFVLSLPWCMLEKTFLERMIDGRHVMFSCPVPKGNSVVVKENGAIALCTHTTSYELASSGEAANILRDSRLFQKFWNSERIMALREEIDVLRHPACIACEYRGQCRGGCPLWWQFFNFSEVIPQLVEKG